mgnify:CR=1 FL=1
MSFNNAIEILRNKSLEQEHGAGNKMAFYVLIRCEKNTKRK